MRALRFSVFELDEAAGELRRGSRRIAITHQAFVTLWLLASRAGALVTREELQRALWNDGTHVDFDRSLNFAIASVRRVLGDDARRPRFVETVTKRGYRFIADVQCTTVETTAEAAAEMHAAPAPIAGLVPVPVPAPIRWASPFRAWALAAAIPIMFFQGTEQVRAHTRLTAAPQAVAAFERGDYETAIALDSRFAEAHFALGSRYESLGRQGAIPERVALERARLSTQLAVSLEEMPESRTQLGSLRLALDWDIDGARADIARALDAAPNWDIGLAKYADVLSAAGNDGAALETIGRAEALSPSCELLALQSAVLHFRARQYDAALAQLDRARALGPAWGRQNDRNWLAELHELGLRIYAQSGKWEEARREASALAAMHGATREHIDALSQVDPRDAVSQFFQSSADGLATSHDRSRIAASRVAVISALAGRADDALLWLERSVGARDADLLFALRDPSFDQLRGSPRFQAVVSETRR